MHVQSPFPFTVPKTGAIITDERCSCGGLRSQHENTFAYGHGPRLGKPIPQVVAIGGDAGADRRHDNTTDREAVLGTVMVPAVLCERFTWVAWVYTTMSVPEGFQALDDRHVVKLERANRRNIGAKGWRYEIRDLSTNREKAKYVCAAPRARTKAEGLEHARAELAHVIKREQLTIATGGES